MKYRVILGLLYCTSMVYGINWSLKDEAGKYNRDMTPRVKYTYEEKRPTALWDNDDSDEDTDEGKDEYLFHKPRKSELEKYREQWKGFKEREFGFYIKREIKKIENPEEKIRHFEDGELIYFKHIMDTRDKIKDIEKNYKQEFLHGSFKKYEWSLIRGTNEKIIRGEYSIEEGEYFYGEKVGKWKANTDYSSSNLFYSEYMNGRLHGKYTNAEGETFEYVNGFKHKKWIERDNEGVKREVIYEYGRIKEDENNEI